LLGCHGPTGYASIAGVLSAIRDAIAIARATGRIADRTGEAIANLTSLLLTSLLLAAGVLAALLSLLARLTGLTGLAATSE